VDDDRVRIELMGSRDDDHLADLGARAHPTKHLGQEEALLRCAEARRSPGGEDDGAYAQAFKPADARTSAERRSRRSGW
jgi:hypothetical protein